MAKRGFGALSFWDLVKKFFGIGNPTGAATKNFTPKRSPSNAVLFFAIVVVGALVAVAAFSKDNPSALTIAWMILGLAIFFGLGTWIFATFNHQERLTGPTLANYLQSVRAMGLGAKDQNLLELTANEPAPLRGQDAGGPKGIGLAEESNGEEEGKA